MRTRGMRGVFVYVCVCLHVISNRKANVSTQCFEPTDRPVVDDTVAVESNVVDSDTM